MKPVIIIAIAFVTFHAIFKGMGVWGKRNASPNVYQISILVLPVI